MFEIGQAVVTKNSGVCKISGKEEKDFGAGSKCYYVLKPYFGADGDTTKVYIPEDRLDVNLRPVMEKNKVIDLIDSMPTIEKLWYSDPKIRKLRFEEIYKSGDLSKICQLVKSLYLQSQELKVARRTLSMLDREFLVKLQNDIYQEFAVALDLSPSEVERFISARIEN